ncbi:PhzF family phenazine biosynthesis protein [Candidatus Beckwithbacteria bacterium]|nr:PhzF family phenazine biosynthesis protein [Candidatus Beckwithbacteria bacterium]
MNIVNVFTDKLGKYGNPLGIIIDEKKFFNKVKRQQIALASGFSEIVFINNIQKRDISIFSPQREIPFAGHAVIGAAYFLDQEYKKPVKQLISMRTKIKTWAKNRLMWVRGDLSITPPWNLEQVVNTLQLEKITVKQASSKKHTLIWSWIDKNKAIIRARTFASDWGISEDEANGSGAMKLTIKLGRDLTIHHGQGSVIYTKISTISGFIDLGGRVRVIKRE